MSLTRRHALGAAVVAAIAPGIIRQGQAAQPAAVNQAPGFYRFKVGDMQVTAINDGFATRPLDGFIRNAPDADVKAALSAAFMATDKMTILYHPGGEHRLQAGAARHGERRCRRADLRHMDGEFQGRRI